MTQTTLIKAYGTATRLLGPLTPVWVRRRARDGKEDIERLDERHGIAGLPRPPGDLVWLHAASVGESIMLLPVINRIVAEHPALTVLVTSGTVTSAALLAERLPEQAIHQYVPLDYPKAVNAFLDHWKPAVAIWAESEIWPNLIRLTKERGIPMALINARMSRKSLDGWAKRGGKSGKALFGAFDLILAANTETSRGLSGIVGRNIEMAGNLKDAALPLPVNDETLETLKAQIARRAIWCAASTHPGEDEYIIAAHQAVMQRHKRAFLILAVRHPERMPDVRKLLQKAGLKYAVRSGRKPVSTDTQVLLFDTIGEMGLAFRLAKISFVCGSMIKGLAGHNPLEPARLGNAVLTGTHIASFADTYMAMFAFNAAKRVLNPNDIGGIVSDLFSDRETLKSLQDNAMTYASSRDAVLDYVWAQLSPLMPAGALPDAPIRPTS